MFEFYSESIHKFSFGDFVVRSTLPLVVSAIVCQLFRNSSAAARHRVWLLGLAAALMVPIAACLLPTIPIPLMPSGVDEIDEVATQSAAKLIDAATLERASVQEISSPSGKSVATASAPATDASHSNKALVPLTLQVAAKQALLFCWLFGICFGASGFILAALQQSMQIRRLSVVADEQWQAAVASAAEQIGLVRCPKTLVSDQQCVPSITGTVRPILIVPSHWRKWSPDERECLLLHELAHIRRHDVPAQCLARIASLVHWFNPLVWFAARQMRIEREFASDDCVLRAGHSASNYAEHLLAIVNDYRSPKPTMGIAMASTARLDDRVRAILDPSRKRQPVGSWFSLMTTFVSTFVCVVVGTITPLAHSVIVADEPPKSSQGPSESKAPVWKENYMVRFEETLPVSVALSRDGNRVLTGSATGELMNMNLNKNQPTYNWKAIVDSAHPAIALSSDGNIVYATTTHGVRLLDANSGDLKELIEEPNSQAIAVQAFPVRRVDDTSYTQIAFGNARGYFVKTWPNTSTEKASTITTSTLPKEQHATDAFAVPLAVDPQGRSAIMTGPIDGTRQVTGKAGANVLWAYVCGSYEEGSPGNRVMRGHRDTVVSAAWSQDGKTAITGDSAGRLIEWDATTMEEKHRRELGGRIAALSISKDGTTAVAYLLGNVGRVVVWNASDSTSIEKVIHVEPEDLSSPTAFASLDISSDGKRVVGCAGDRLWLDQSIQPHLVGRVRVWELETAPRDQPIPKLLYTLPTIERSHFVIPNNHSLVRTVAQDDRPGSVDFVDLSGGEFQLRFQISELPLGRLSLSQDCEWVAIEQQTRASHEEAGSRFDVVVRNAMVHMSRATVSDCERLLDLSKNGDVVAVVRDGAVELWDISTTTRIKRAPFKHARIDAAKFSPDSSQLAICGQHTLVLWRWQEDQFESIDIGREVTSLAYSPDGKRLAEGPAADTSIQIRDIETTKVVQTLSRDSMSVPHLIFTQGGRVLIACDRLQFKDPAIDGTPRPRIFIWDTLDGSLVHEMSTSGPVSEFHLSPNERFVVAQVDGPNATTINGWRLDGETIEIGGNKPASAQK